MIDEWKFGSFIFFFQVDVRTHSPFHGLRVGAYLHLLASSQTTGNCEHGSSQTVQTPLSAYHEAGLAFAPLVSNSLGQLGPNFHRFLWGLADHAARNQVPVELQDFPLLDIDSPSPVQAAFQCLRSLIYV